MSGEKPAEGLDINDPDYQLHAKVFNALTAHPGCDLIYSARKRVTDRTISYIWRQVRKEKRRRARYRRRRERKHGRTRE